jgi:hypothetical protein
MPTIYPILKPGDWPHKELIAHFTFVRDARVPVVAFGFDAGDTYQFVTTDQCADVSKLFVEALVNLSELEYEWELGDSYGLRFAASSGHEFSAELILDPDAMRECQRMLGASRIVAASPRRTCLFATSDGQSDEVMSLFHELVTRTYEDDSYGHAPISPTLFVIEDGQLKSFRP